MAGLIFRLVTMALTWGMVWLVQPKICGKTLFENEESGEIRSPNFPSIPPGNVSCHWTIKVPNGHKLELNFKIFLLKPDLKCQKEYIQVTFSDLNYESESYRYCGKKESFIIETQKPKTVITYRTAENSFPGFDLLFKVTKNDEKENQISSRDENSGSTCSCGIRPQKTQFKRIVGGSSLSEPHEFPWMAIIVNQNSRGKAFCGATILTANWVVTAAHCTYNRNMLSYLVVAGVNDIANLDDNSRQERKIDALFQHPNYNHDIENYDISVLKLKEPFKLCYEVWPACLPPKNKMFVGDIGIAAGWGKTAYMGKSSNLPREIQLPIVTNEECAKAFKNTNANVTQYMLCAGVLDGSLDACQGDSGGPLMWKNPVNNQWCIIGIISYGVKCATPGYYGVYSRITALEDFIGNVTGMQGRKCLVEENGLK